MKPALLFYCQHCVGLGHLMRSYALAEALAGGTASSCWRAASCPWASTRRRTSRSSRCRRWASNRRGLRERRPALQHRARLGAPRRAHRQALGTRPADGRARRAVPVRAREVRPRADPAARAGARAGRHDRLQPARHPRLHAREPARARQPRGRDRQRAPGPDPRALRPPLRPPGGDLQAEHAAARAGPLHRLRRPQRERGRTSAASTSSSRPAAGGSAGRCSRRRPRRRRAGQCGPSPAR